MTERDDERDKQMMEREEHLDAETIAEDAEELFSKKATQPPLQPDAPPPNDPSSD